MPSSIAEREKSKPLGSYRDNRSRVCPVRALRSRRYIGLSTFIRFDSADGNRRIDVVEERRSGEWSTAIDFYLPLRHGIRRAAGRAALEAATFREAGENQADGDKRRRYALLADGYAAFVRRYHAQVAGTVATGLWSELNLRVRTDPEVIFIINGERLITKIYLPKEPLDHQRLTASLQLLRETYPLRGFRVAILDCERGRLYKDTRLDRTRSPILLRVKAAEFVGIWRALEQGVSPAVVARGFPR